MMVAEYRQGNQQSLAMEEKPFQFFFSSLKRDHTRVILLTLRKPCYVMRFSSSVETGKKLNG